MLTWPAWPHLRSSPYLGADSLPGRQLENAWPNGAWKQKQTQKTSGPRVGPWGHGLTVSAMPLTFSGPQCPGQLRACGGGEYPVQVRGLSGRQSWAGQASPSPCGTRVRLRLVSGWSGCWGCFLAVNPQCDSSGADILMLRTLLFKIFCSSSGPASLMVGPLAAGGTGGGPASRTPPLGPEQLRARPAPTLCPTGRGGLLPPDCPPHLPCALGCPLDKAVGVSGSRQ